MFSVLWHSACSAFPRLQVWNFNGCCLHRMKAGLGRAAEISQVLLLKRSILVMGWERCYNSVHLCTIRMCLNLRHRCCSNIYIQFAVFVCTLCMEETAPVRVAASARVCFPLLPLNQPDIWTLTSQNAPGCSHSLYYHYLVHICVCVPHITSALHHHHHFTPSKLNSAVCYHQVIRLPRSAARLPPHTSLLSRVSQR